MWASFLNSLQMNFSFTRQEFLDYVKGHNYDMFYRYLWLSVFNRTNVVWYAWFVCVGPSALHDQPGIHRDPGEVC